MLVDIDAVDVEAFVLEFCHHWLHGFAGTAPGSVEEENFALGHPRIDGLGCKPLVVVQRDERGGRADGQCYAEREQLRADGKHIQA